MNETKQIDINTITSPKSINTLLLNHSDITLVQYLILNLFRIVRPIRIKYKLTVNEVIFLSGVICYHKLYNSVFSNSQMRQFIGYFNLNKYSYYINKLVEKGCIVQSDIINGSPRYKLSEYGLSILNRLQNDYDDSLSKFIDKHNIIV